MIKRLLSIRELGIALVLLVEIAVFAWLLRQPGQRNVFLGSEAFLKVVRDTAVLGVAAIGTTIVIISGGIDLSVGSVIALATVTAAAVLKAGWAPVAAVPAAVLVGLACGQVTAAVINLAKLPPFIVTLGMMSIARGGAFLLTRGSTITLIDSPYARAVNADLRLGPLLVPAPVVVLVAVALGCALLMSRTTFGRAVFALGGNEEAARLSGLRVARLKRLVYGLAGACAGLAGCLFVGQYSTGQSTAAAGWELDAIAAAVLGGASLSGGRGSIVGTCLGALIFRVLLRGLTMLNASDYSQVITGVVVIVVVVLDQVATARARRAAAAAREETVR